MSGCAGYSGAQVEIDSLYSSTVTVFLTLWAVGCYNYSRGEEISDVERRSPCRSWINPKPRHS